jgi:hypothetical protein
MNDQEKIGAEARSVLSGLASRLPDPGPPQLAVRVTRQRGRAAAPNVRGLAATTLLVGVFAAFLLVARSGDRAASAPPSDATIAKTLCGGPGATLAQASSSGSAALVATIASSGDQARAWIGAAGQHVQGNPKWEGLASASLVAFCYYDGDFTGFPQPPGANLTYSRMLVLVSNDGHAELFAVGNSSMSLAGPAAPAP